MFKNALLYNFYFGYILLSLFILFLERLEIAAEMFLSIYSTTPVFCDYLLIKQSGNHRIPSIMG